MPYDLLLLLSVLFTLFCAGGLCYEFYKDYRKSHRKSRKGSKRFAKPKVPYTRLINEVVHWTGPHLKENSIKHYPKVKIIYRRHQSVRGRYRSSKKTIELYVHPKIKLEQLVKTTLHEIRHYMQHKTDPAFDSYDRYSAKMGYEQNPFEVDSRSYANKHYKPCLEYLRSNGWV